MYFYREVKGGRNRGRETSIRKKNMYWLPLAHPLLGTWLATQACALIGNQTSDLLVRRPGLNPLSHISQGSTFFFKDFIYLFLERGEGKERERNINMYLPLERPPLGTWPTTQACALTGNPTGDPLIHRPALNSLSYSSQGLTA